VVSIDSRVRWALTLRRAQASTAETTQSLVLSKEELQEASLREIRHQSNQILELIAHIPKSLGTDQITARVQRCSPSRTKHCEPTNHLDDTPPPFPPEPISGAETTSRVPFWIFRSARVQTEHTCSTFPFQRTLFSAALVICLQSNSEQSVSWSCRGSLIPEARRGSISPSSGCSDRLPLFAAGSPEGDVERRTSGPLFRGPIRRRAREYASRRRAHRESQFLGLGGA